MKTTYLEDMMLVATENLVSITDANQNFSRVARLVDERGAVVILRNNKPRYVVMEYSPVNQEADVQTRVSDTTVAEAGSRFIAKHLAAFTELAK
jgi:antitoxin Phd